MIIRRIFSYGFPRSNYYICIAYQLLSLLLLIHSIFICERLLWISRTPIQIYGLVSLFFFLFGWNAYDFFACFEICVFIIFLKVFLILYFVDTIFRNNIILYTFEFFHISLSTVIAKFIYKSWIFETTHKEIFLF